MVFGAFPVAHWKRRSVFPAGAWSATTSLSATIDRTSSVGTLTNTVISGGVRAGLGVNERKAFDGTTWTNLLNLSTAIFSSAAAGVANSHIRTGGRLSNGTFNDSTETWNGSTNGNGGNLLGNRAEHGAAGSQTVTIVFGGSNNGTTDYKATSETNSGTTWSAGPVLSVARRLLGGCGESRAACLAAGGWDGTVRRTTEHGDAVAWTVGGNLITTTDFPVMTGSSHLSALAHCYSTCEAYDGIAWAARPAMATARDNLGDGISGSSPTALAIGGMNPATTATCEKYT